MNGHPFNQQTVDDVWEKGQIIDYVIEDTVRDDKSGKHISKFYYGSEREFGWEIDHIKPVSKGGTDAIDNLQPLHWENNRKKGNNGSVHNLDKKE